MNTAVAYLQTQPSRQPLAQVEVLVLFSPALQHGGPQPIRGAVPVSCEQAWVTLDVYGIPSHGDLTGRPIIEDMRLESNGEDIQAHLPESMVERIEKYVLEVI